MSKLSPGYREDSYEGLSQNVRQYLDENFLIKLTNREVANPKLLVVFSGGNAVGKSSLSQKIAKELRGVVLENDVIKLHILRLYPHIDKDELQLLTWKYTMDVYQRCSHEIKNGLIVRDGVIDWYYDKILPIFEKQSYGLFVVGYSLSRQRIIELINSRGDKPTVSTHRLIAQLGDHEIHQKRFRKVYRPDILLTDDTVFDHERVIELIRLRVDELRHRS